MSDSNDVMFVDINSDYIQALYKERDEALARNRKLEEQVEVLLLGMQFSQESIQGLLTYIQELENRRHIIVHGCDEAEKQIAELEKQIAELEKQVRALKEEMSGFPYAVNIQKEQIAEWQELAKDLLRGLQDCWDNEYSLEELQSLQSRVKELLEEKE
jgi:chromosome segregation ATPase